MISRRQACLGAAATMIAAATPARAAARIRIATQKTGTFSWELELMRARGLDKAGGFEIDVVELASPDAGRIALRGGSADVIVTDLTWIARQRALGDRMLFHPYSSTIGAIMVAETSPIRALGDLRGRKLGVAGGPLDKSFVLLNALAARSKLDLSREAQLVYGAPPLLTQKLLQGELDALLTYWNFAAHLQARGHRELINMADVQTALGASAPVAFLGYGFSEAFAQRQRAALDAFLRAGRRTKELIVADDDAWAQIAPRTGVDDPRERDLYRRLYAAGVPRDDAAAREDALRLLALLDAAEGGKLGAPDAGLFYAPQS